jgi:putative protease
VVTKCYREALEAIVQNSYTPEKIEHWKKELAKVYNRGFWEGYYLGRKFGEWTPHPGSAATEKKVYLGKGQRYYPKIGVGEFLLESGTLKAGDTIMITSPTFGMMKEAIHQFKVNGADAVEAKKGDVITFISGNKISPKDKIYKVVENA